MSIAKTEKVQFRNPNEKRNTQSNFKTASKKNRNSLPKYFPAGAPNQQKRRALFNEKRCPTRKLPTKNIPIMRKRGEGKGYILRKRGIHSFSSKEKDARAPPHPNKETEQG